MVVFSVLDRAQHDYWADMDPSIRVTTRDASREFREFIHETYKQLDAAIGRLIEDFPRTYGSCRLGSWLLFRAIRSPGQ